MILLVVSPSRLHTLLQKHQQSSGLRCRSPSWEACMSTSVVLLHNTVQGFIQGPYKKAAVQASLDNRSRVTLE